MTFPHKGLALRINQRCALRGVVADFDEFGEFDDDLIEIERASAVLHQRDPDQAEQVVSELRARRAEEKRREEAARKIREVAAKRRRVRRTRIAIVVGVVAIIAVVSIPLTKAVMNEARRARALQGDLTEAAQPVMTMPFELGQEWLDVPPAGVSFEAPRNTCSVILGIGEGKASVLPIRLERPGIDPVEYDGGLLWCSCDKEQAMAKFVGSTNERLALRWLNARMGTVGGIEVLLGKALPGYRVIADARAFGCADAAFTTWAQTAGLASLSPVDERMAEALEPLHRERFVPLGILTTEQRFGVVPGRKDQCYLVLPFGERSPVTLRNADGKRLIDNTMHAMGWCTYDKDRAYSVWRKDPGPPRMLVLEVQARHVGGLTGLKESAARHGANEFDSVLENEDLQQDALAALLASGVGENSIVKGGDTGLPGKANSRVVAFSRYRSSSFLPDVAPAIPVACEPRMSSDALFQTYVCVQARPQRWRREGSIDSQGAAEAGLPFWLSLLSDAKDEKSLRAIAQMLAFSRRMTLLGFEPTTTDGVRDSAFGGEILGRPNRTEALAIGLTKRHPWIHPLTHGPSWKLDGELPIIKVDPEKSVKVRTIHGGLGAIVQDRRMVVWRR